MVALAPKGFRNPTIATTEFANIKSGMWMVIFTRTRLKAFWLFLREEYLDSSIP